MLNQCPVCLNMILGELCDYHSTTSEAITWSRGNRIWCDILHRGAPFPKRIEKGLLDLTN